jgi:hypothetical protein
MTEISGQPIVNRSDSVAASYLKAQDYLFNPTSGGGGVSLPPVNTISFSQGTFTASGHTTTAAASGVGYGPAGYLQIQISGANVVIPFFTP